MKRLGVHGRRNRRIRLGALVLVTVGLLVVGLAAGSGGYGPPWDCDDDPCGWFSPPPHLGHGHHGHGHGHHGKHKPPVIKFKPKINMPPPKVIFPDLPDQDIRKNWARVNVNASVDNTSLIDTSGSVYRDLDGPGYPYCGGCWRGYYGYGDDHDNLDLDARINQWGDIDVGVSIDQDNND